MVALAGALALLAGFAADRAGGTFPGANGKIAYASTRFGGEQIFVANANGSNEVQLTGNVGSDGSVNTHPAWSPDGSTIVFDSNRNGGSGHEDVYVMKADGTGQTRLTTDAGSDLSPGFSPDGKRICFSSNRDGDYEIYTMRSDGTDVVQVTSNTGVDDVRCSWSPAGNRIAYESASDVWTARTNGTESMNLTVQNGGFDGRPSWSPDGTAILFDSVRGGASSIYRMTAGGLSQDPVTDGTDDINPDPSPDDAQLAFERGSQVYVAAGDGSAAGRITPDAGSNTEPAWQPERGPIHPNPSCTITQDHSISGVTETAITFVNETGVALKVYWLDYQGNRVFYQSLADGASYAQPTWLTHPWVGLDSDGRCYGYTISDAASKTYVFGPLDTTPPDTTITGTPADGATTDSTVATYTFSSTEPGSTFNCVLDGAGFEGCPPRGNELFAIQEELGAHTFSVSAVDPSGNVDPTPATRSWTIVPPPPPDNGGSTSIASLTNAGTASNGSASFPSLSNDGNVVGFESAASLTPAGSNGSLQAYVRNRGAGTTVVVSGVDNFEGGLTLGNANSGYVQVSGNGDYAAFQSLANNVRCLFAPGAEVPICPPDTTRWHVYLRILAGPGIAVVDANGGFANGHSQHPAVNGDGTLVAFDSAATNLGPVDTNGVPDIYLRSMSGSVLERMSVTTVAGGEANGASSYPTISPNGRYVAFVSDASNLVPNDVNGHSDVFLRDRETGTTTLVSVSTAGDQGNADSGGALAPSISPDGRYVAFTSRATNFARQIANNTDHVFVRDLVAGTTEKVDVSSTEDPANAQSTAPSISDDGRYVTFTSAASAGWLSPLVTTDGIHVYRRDRQLGTTNVVDLNPAGDPGNGTSHNAQFGTGQSADGRFAVFMSDASDLIGAGKDTNSATDVFVRDFEPPAVPDSVTADLTAGAATVEAGAANVPIADLPLSLALEPSTTSSSPVAQQPVAQQPVAQQPIAQQPVAQQPIAQQPIAQFGLTLAGVADALGDVSLASLPTTYPGGWLAIQKDTKFEGYPAQSVTLGQLLRSYPKTCSSSCGPPPPLDGVTTSPRQLRMGDLDLSQSRLRNLPLLAFAYGSTLLSSLDPAPATGGTTNQPALTDWCTAFAGPPLNCTSPTSLSGQTVMGAALLGAPVAQQPVAQQPVAQQPIAQQPIAQFPIAQFPIAQFGTSASPVAQQPVAQQDLAASHFDTLSLREILRAGSRLGTIQISSLRNAAAIVTGGSGTLAQAFAQSESNIVAGATLGTLAANADLSGFTLGDIAYYDDLKVIDLVNGLPAGNTYTIADLIAIMVSRTALEWESIPASRLAAFGKNPAGLMTWHAGFTLGGEGTGGTDLRLTLPSGFRYVAGSAKLRHASTATALPDPAVANGVLTFTVPDVVFGDPYTLDVDTYAGFVLGPTQATLDVLPRAGSLTGADSAAVAVTDTFEGNDAPAAAKTVAPNSTLQLSYVSQSGDVDWFAVPTQAGDRISVHLANVTADFDLSIIAPAKTQLRPNTAGGPPLQAAPVRDTGIDATNTRDSLEPAPLQDTPVAQQPVAQQPVAQQSVNRGANDEDAGVISTGGTYLIKVAGYGDASSPTPYSLRITETPPVVDPVCSRRVLPALGAGERGTAPATIPATTNTVFLVNRYRLAQSYTPADAANVMTALAGLAGQSGLGVRGVVEPVEAWPGMQALYDSWDENPCSATRANAVSTAIAGIVDSVRQSAPNLKYVVLVGGYDQLPPFLIPDLTRIANETGYASTFAGNQYWGWLASSNIMSDEPYYDTDPVSIRDAQFFLGDLVGGRLVETPQQIVTAATRFSNASVNGTLNRSTALSTGYDFVKDGALAAADAAKTYLPATSVRTLINDGYSAADLVSALFPTGGASSLNGINGHFDHYRTLSAAGNAGGTLDVLDTAGIDARSGALAGDVLYSVGCHAGLPVSDVVVGLATPSRDWAQSLADQNAVWAANSGFGLGDTDTVAFSERLMALFSGNLNGSLSIGEALARAKQQYYLDRPTLSSYDEKALLEASLFGLPFYNVGAVTAAPSAPTTVPGTTAATTPAASPVAPDPVSGLGSAVFSATPAFTLVTGQHGRFYTNAGGVDVVHYRPIVPRIAMPATKTGLRAHSAFIESLTSTDESGFDGDFAMPTEDRTALSPEPVFGDAAFPSTLATIVSAKVGQSVVSQLNVDTGQFSTDATLDNAGVGLMRRFTQVSGRVFYSTGTGFDPPTILSTSATKFGSNVGFVADVCDSVRTYVLFHDLGDPGGKWVGVNLVKDTSAGSCRWTGGAPIVGPEVEYFVQACKAGGDCAQSTNKARNYDAQNAPESPPPAPGQGTLTISLTGTAVPPTGFFTDQVQVSATDTAPGVTLSAKIDGVARTLPATVSTDGFHLVTVEASDGGRAARAFLIDRTSPSVVIAVPAEGGIYELGSSVKADYTCLDSGSGVKTCAGPVANGADIPTAQIGDNTFTVTATDAVGHTASATRHYLVSWPFAGFLPPVNNLPTLNDAKAGSSIPVKFSLKGNRGLDIFAAGSPSAASIACDSTAPVDPVEETATAAASGLTYDATSDQYTYVWKTQKSWAGSCRQLIVKLRDGTFHRANFRFK